MTTAGTITNENNVNEIMDADTSEDQRQALTAAPKEFSKWEDLEDFNSDLLRGIYAHGFDKPSIIQQKSILSLFEQKDMIAQAQSGTGKTGAFSVGVLHNVDTSVAKVQAIILVPTRELAKQIQDVISSLGSFMKLLKIQLLDL